MSSGKRLGTDDSKPHGVDHHDARQRGTRVTSSHASLTRLASLATTVLESLMTVIVYDGSTEPICVERPDRETGGATDERMLALAHTLHDRMTTVLSPLAISDVSRRSLLDTDSAIPNPTPVACLGVPLVLSSGHLTGSVWVIDDHVRLWGPSEIETLSTLGEAMVALIEHERHAADARRSLRAAMRERRQTEALLERMTDCFAAFDRAWTLTYANQRAATFLGAPQEELIGKTLWEVWPGIRELDAFTRVARAVEDERSDDFEVHDDEHDAWLEVRVFPSREGVSIFLRDITERKWLEAALVEEHHQREAFLATASHEIKTPLTTIKGIAQLLGRRVPSGDVRISSLVGRLQDEVVRMERLVVELLDTSRIHQGYLALEHERIDLVALVHEVVGRFGVSPLMRDSHRIMVLAPEGVHGTWDRERLDQIVTNLMSNALKYSPDGGEVRVEVAIEGDDVGIYVSDSGVGMTPEIQVRAFEPFKSGAGEIGAEGTGLGLYIVKQIVEHHGGTIGVDSEPGHGSTFTVRLPRTTRPTPTRPT